MDAHLFNVLEFNSVKKNISKYSEFRPGRDLVFAIKPFNEIYQLRKKQKETSEYLNFNKKYGFYNLTICKFINKILNKAVIQSILNQSDLMDIADNIQISEEVYLFYNKDKDFDIINNEVNRLSRNTFIKKEIKRCISDKYIINDNASSELNEIRKKINNYKNKINSILEKMLKDNSVLKMLQEPFITIRNDRFVLPVKNEYKNKFSGHIVDISSSGLSVFMEPSEIMSIGNDLRNYFFDEKKEEEKILRKLSSMVYEKVNELKNDQKIIAKVDFYQSVSRWSQENKCIMVSISDKSILDIINARCPLIKDPVAININIGEKYKTLIIT